MGLRRDRGRSNEKPHSSSHFDSFDASSSLRIVLFLISHGMRLSTRLGSSSRSSYRATQVDQLELRDLDRLLQRLPPDLREVLLLVGVEELSYQAVAEALCIPVGTVMSRLSRARERLRVELSGQPAVAKIQRVK